MQQVLLVLSLSGLALCGSLSNEYLPASSGLTSNSAGGSFGPHAGGAISTYSSTSRFPGSGSVFGASSVPSSQYGVPSTSHFGRQYASPSQYNRPSAPAPVYGAPSQNFGVSSFRSSTPFSAGQTLPSAQYGAPFKGSGVSSFGRSTPFSSGSQYIAPSSQYGAPSAFGQSISVDAAPSHFNSRIGQGRSLSTQYGAPQQYQAPQFAQQSSSFRAGPQFGGVSSQGVLSAHRPAAGYSGTVQDENGGYIY